MSAKGFILLAGFLFASLLAGCARELAPPEPPASPPPASVPADTVSAAEMTAATPAAQVLSPERFGEIDAIVEEAIREKATPGAVVLVLVDGRTVFEGAYGHHTYEGESPTQSSDIFDLASLTKVFATTLAAMRLVDEGRLDLDAQVGSYLTELKRSHPDKAAVRMRDLLTHRAGFVPYIPFFMQIREGDHRSAPSADYPVKVADHYYLARDYYQRVMWKRMLDTPLKTPGKYVYSDIGISVLQAVLERIARQPLDVYVEEQFYRPLGLRSTGFRPRERFAGERIVPTEEDTYFRRQLLRGYVQDPGAAMAGGVAGHAGLFSSAGDLAVLAQMLLDGGNYSGRQYLRPETVKLFSSRQAEDSRRGLGFDCRDPESEEGYPCRLASPGTFGHTGFTGTCVWIDPERRLIYIFLSNRLYPAADRNKLLKLNIRPRIHDAIYEALRAEAG